MPIRVGLVAGSTVVELPSDTLTTVASGEITVFVGVWGFLPPVSHMIATIRKASPMRSQDWTFFGRRPCGLGDAAIAAQ